MRRDMFKIIVERPRRFPPGGWTKGRPRRNIEDGPSREGMRRPYDSYHERKELNENLAPLRRFLLKQVGRPWNKVYSEICEHLRADSVVQNHVRLHLEDFVSLHVEMRPDGTPTLPGSRWPAEAVALLYVHPRTGILRLNRYHPRIRGRGR